VRLDYRIAPRYARAVESTEYMVTARNLLVSAGAYFISGWLGIPLSLGFGKLTQGFIYRGDFNGYIVSPVVVHLPRAIVAASAGAVVVWLVESDRPVTWAFPPAILYGLLGFFGYHWAHPPIFMDRVSQTIGALFPALACIVGALISARYRATHRESRPSPV
jgi:hypothetical protein